MKKSIYVHFLSMAFVLVGYNSILSCNNQLARNNKSISTDSLSLGKTATKIDNRTWSVFQDQNNNYWFGTNGMGVLKFDGETLVRYTTKDGLIDNSIRGFRGDNKGNVFIQTPVGISKYDGDSFTTLKITPSTGDDWKLSPNDLWFNCNGNTLNRYDGENLYELSLPEQDLKKAFGVDVQGVGFKDMNHSPYAVYGLDKDKSGNLWIGTVTAGAFRYDGNTFLWVADKELSTLPDGRVPGVRSMLEDKNGYMWLSNFISKYEIIEKGTETSYKKLEGINKSNPCFDGKIGYYNSGLADKKGDLWFTTYGGGVWKYDGKELIHYPVIYGDTEVLIVSIYQDNKDVLWLGTDNVGVFKFNGKKFEKFEIKK